LRFQQERSLNPYIAKSSGVHLIVVGLITAVPIVLGIQFFTSNSKINKVLESSVRVDIVAMPKFTERELKKMKITASKPIEPERIEKVAVSKETSKVEFKKKSNIDVNNLLNKYSKVNIKTPKKNIPKKKEITVPKGLKNLILEGNKISKGSNTTGTSTQLGQEAFDRYAASLPNSIRQFWKLPSYLLDKGLKCRIKVYLAANGTVTNMKIFESSGEKEFDQKALEALRKSSPLPAPPKETLARVASGEIILGFPI